MTGRVLIAFVAVTVIWGSTYSFMKIGLGYWPPMLFAAARNLLGFLVLCMVVRRARLPLPTGWVHWWPPLAYGVINGIGFAIMFWSLQHLDSGVGAVILGTIPLFTLLIGRVWPGTPILPLQLLAVALGFAGVWLVSVSGRELEGTVNPMTRIAEVGLLVSAVWFAVSYLFAKRSFGQNVIGNTLGHLGSSGVLLLLLAVALGSPPTAAVLTLPAIGVLLYLGVVGSALAYGLIFYLLENVGPLGATYINLGAPAVAVLIGVLFLGEKWTLPGLVGIASILSGAWLVSRPVHRISGRTAIASGGRR